MKFSIITVNLNNLSGLKATYQSIIHQTAKNFEYLVIDGDSNDGSKEFIESNSDQLDYWHSKKDKGIYDAMNDGIQKATGEYLLFLNSGDVFYNDEVLRSIEPFMSEDIVYGDIEIGGNKKSIIESPKTLTFENLLKFTLPHQATFIKKELFDKYGLYDHNLKICADWTFFIDVICKNNATYKYAPLTITSFDPKGISSLTESLSIITEEKEQHLKQNYAAFIDHYRSTEVLINKYTLLKNSRLRKYLSVIFKQLKL